MTDEDKPDEAEKPVRRRRAKAENQPCEQCWPNGWRTENVTSANCIHGNWTR
jgi:hypothetical protein